MSSYKKAYTVLADFYEHLMNKVNYDAWAEYLYDIIKDSIPTDSNVLELAGGSGSISFYLQKYFHEYILTDKSWYMLNKASEYSLSLVCCDMQYLPFKKKFGLILSTFDSVNYLLTKKSLQNMFSSVQKILDENGIFTFDASLFMNSIALAEEKVTTNKYKNIHYKQISHYDTESRIHSNVFIINLPGQNEIVEIHRQRIWDFEEYFDIMDKCGLYVVDCFENFTMKKGKPTSKRVQFIVRKSNKDAVIQ